ncbi:MAG: HAMP domain-containing histidine kinase, partial [Pseudonocardiales bacterium]|nr:HAMP domain-containing histidine kinase [Pseudonocardiales bacterium]
MTRRSIAWRVAAACLAVALVAVVVAAAVGLRLVSETARQVTADVLAQEADIVAAQLDEPGLIGNPGPVRQAAASRKVVQTLQSQGVDIVLLGRARTGTGPVATALTEANADRALAGNPVSASVDVEGRTYVVEARPAASSAFALVRRSDTGPLGNGLIRRNVGFALLAGAGVALLVGLVVGTLMARPLRRTATAAHLLRTGRRDVRVPVQGPAEVAEVAAAVNELADALARSEGRQREFLLSVSHELRTPLTAV